MRGTRARDFPRRHALIGIILVFVGAGCSAPITTSRPTPARDRVLVPCRPTRYTSDILCGTYEVFENRETRTGRRIPLNIVVLPALDPKPAPDPIFHLTGGPGRGAASTAAEAGDGLMRE